MAKQTFTAGQVLTAAQVNALQSDIFNQTVSTKTANYTFVVGDRGTRVVGNGTSITFTVDNTIFSAGDTIKIHNINSTTLTIAAGVGVTINAAAGLTMAQYQEAVLFATSASSFILFESSASSAQGLTLLNTTSFSGVSAFSLAADTFTTTYTNYFILFDATTSISSEIYARLRVAGVNATGNDYSNQWVRGLSTSVGANAYTSTTANVNVADGAGKHVLEIYVYSPKLAVPTRLTSKFQSVAKPGLGISAISHSLSTAYDSLSIYPDSGGTITGKASVYGFNE